MTLLPRTHKWGLTSGEVSRVSFLVLKFGFISVKLHLFSHVSTTSSRHDITYFSNYFCADKAVTEFPTQVVVHQQQSP